MISRRILPAYTRISRSAIRPRCQLWAYSEVGSTWAKVSGAVSNAIHSRTSAWEPLARKTLLRDLYRETGLPKNMLREEISAQFGSNPKKTDYAYMQ